METTTTPLAGLFTTTCGCGLVRTMHVASLRTVEAQGHRCPECLADADRAANGWTPENSLS